MFVWEELHAKLFVGPTEQQYTDSRFHLRAYQLPLYAYLWEETEAPRGNPHTIERKKLDIISLT